MTFVLASGYSDLPNICLFTISFLMFILIADYLIRKIRKDE